MKKIKRKKSQRCRRHLTANTSQKAELTQEYDVYHRYNDL